MCINEIRTLYSPSVIKARKSNDFSSEIKEPQLITTYLDDTKFSEIVDSNQDSPELLDDSIYNNDDNIYIDTGFFEIEDYTENYSTPPDDSEYDNDANIFDDYSEY